MAQAISPANRNSLTASNQRAVLKAISGLTANPPLQFDGNFKPAAGDKITGATGLALLAAQSFQRV